jgi:FAD:protein FMN transferase
MPDELDYRFRSMGSDIRFLIGKPLANQMPAPRDAAEREKAYVLDFAHRLSRFLPDSELSLLNHDRRTEVPASELLCAAVAAGLWAAERSGGLVVPTLTGELESIGYMLSLEGAEPASLTEALAAAPSRRPAGPDPHERWRQVEVDPANGVIRRPVGLMLDTGGTGKGLCADAVAHRLGDYTRCVVDCGGDIAVGGVGTHLDPYRIEIEHPLSRQSVGTLTVAQGGVATSGLNVRIWRRRDGGYAHHLLDPATGQPAWTGLIGATALASTALEAETLSKMALLLGPEGAREVLAEHGGMIVHDSGEIEQISRSRNSHRSSRTTLGSNA